jgi:hypothetical protein
VREPCRASSAGVPLFLAAAAGFPTTRLETINLVALPFMPLLTLLQSITLLSSCKKRVAQNE